MKTLFAGASALILGVAMAGAVQAAEAEAATDSAELDAVIVTGTRTTGLRAVDSPAPITVLDSTALQRTGQGDLIQAIAQNVPSFNAQAFGGDTANLTLSAKLRGLSPNHALILVNGKRRHGTANLAVLGGPYQGGASADLNFITLGAVDHIEVLQEGAAAQYGTDAIAGVINIILKNKDSGGGVTVSAGKYFDGDGDTADITMNVGFAPIEDAYVNLSFESRYHGYSFRGVADPRVTNTTFNINSSSRLSRYPQIANDPRFPFLNRAPGDAEYRLNVGAFNMGWKVGDSEIYAFGTYGDKYASAYENYRVPNLIVGKDGSIPRPNGFSPREVIYETDYSVTGGVSSDLGDGWKADVSATYARDEVSINTKNSFNRSLYIDTSTLTTPGFSPNDCHAGDINSTQKIGQLDMSKEFDVGMATPLTFAFGGEYRKEIYEIKPGDPASRYKEGSQSYPGFALTDAGKHDRKNYAVYGDLAVSPVEALKVDLAGRYEHFTDFGSTFVAKLTGRYDFNTQLAVRGTASTGFRAPTLAEEYYSATNVSPTSAFVQLPPNSPAAALVGVNGLDPEKSRNFSVGFVAHPGWGVTATLDLYQISIRDRVVGSGSLFGSGGDVNLPAVLAAIKANGNVLDPTVVQTGINIFTNGLNTRSRGAELVLTTMTSLEDWGSIQWSLTGNYQKTKVTKIAANPPQLGGASLFDLTTIDNLETASPKYKVVGGALWTWNDLQVSLKETVYGPASRHDSRTGCSIATGATSPTCFVNKIKTQIITDLEISYKILPTTKLSIGANNLFNAYPDKLNPAYVQTFIAGNSQGGAVQYPTFSSFGINGGYYYTKLTYSF